MKKLTSLNLLVTLAVLTALAAGCSVVSGDLTGTPGARYTGYWRSASGTTPQAGMVPGRFRIYGLGIGSVTFLDCEYTKSDSNTTIFLRIRAGRFDQTVGAPPGTSGVRAKRTDSSYVLESF